jgi:large subunit ribosomal protein L29
MAERTAEEIRRFDDPTLDREINEAYRALFTLRFQHASRQLQNYRELRNVKRRIARLRTIRRERQLAALEEQE